MQNIDSKGAKCLFCGKPKTYWKSEIMLFVGGKCYYATVCPEDRKTHTIQDLYEEAAKQVMKGMEKVLAEYDAKRLESAAKVADSLDQSLF